MEIHISRGGAVIGKYSPAVLLALIKSRQVLPTDAYWRAGMTAWAEVFTLDLSSLETPQPAKETEMPKVAEAPAAAAPVAPPEGDKPEASPAGRLYLALGLLAVPVATVVSLLNKSELTDLASIFLALPEGSPKRFKVADLIADVGGEMVGTVFLVLAAWAVAAIIYFVIRGRGKKEDEKVIYYGNCGFLGAAVIAGVIFALGMKVASPASRYLQNYKASRSFNSDR